MVEISTVAAKPSWSIMIFCIVSLLLGSYVLYSGIKNLENANQSGEWSTANGSIISSDVRNEIKNSNGRSSTVYFPRVAYQYIVGNNSFISDRISFGDYGSGSESRAIGIAGKYPMGSQVTVHYNPSDPSQSVIETGVNFGAYLNPAIGLIFVIVGALGLFFSFRNSESS
jgi:hypothetical protein